VKSEASFVRVATELWDFLGIVLTPCSEVSHTSKTEDTTAMTKKLTVAEKYRQLKAQTESAGMKVEEVDGKIVVRRKPKNKK
jgi:hypothetical protein